MKKISGIIIVALMPCVGLLCWSWQEIERFARTPLAIEQETIFTLPAGTSRAGLEALLRKNNVITDSTLFQWLLRIEPRLAKFKAGTYRLMPAMQLREMLSLLSSGKEAQFSIRFVEGTTLRDWLHILQRAQYMQHQLTDKSAQDIAQLLGMKNNTHPEGWFWPDTWQYTAGTSDLALLKRAHQRMEKVVAEIWRKRDAALPYKTPNELLTMASIIEKETALEHERAKIASVFINRLRLGMRLQTDPTVIYGAGEKQTGTISRKDLATPTAYNTYIIDGLPPTPIATPGYASLIAAAHPASTPWLYFVTDGQGGHNFTTNLAAHNKAVAVYRRRITARNEK